MLLRETFYDFNFVFHLSFNFENTRLIVVIFERTDQFIENIFPYSQTRFIQFSVVICEL